MRRSQANLVSVRSGRPHALVSRQQYCGKLSHMRSCRGHTDPVYLVTGDLTDKYIITGSDDCLVKIWSMTTNVLLMTCRGHEVRLPHHPPMVAVLKVGPVEFAVDRSESSPASQLLTEQQD